MDFDVLKSFIAVAEEKSFSLAAKHLFMSQQSLSKQISRLEEELGEPLFLRSRPLGLTTDGKLFLQTAKRILQLRQEFEDNSSRGMGSNQVLHIGIEHTVARAVLPHVLPSFLESYPDTFLQMSEESPEILQKSVARDGVDLVIGSISGTPDNYESVPLCRKEHILVVPKRVMRELAGEGYEAKKEEFSGGADLSFFASAPFIKIPRLSSGGRALNSYLKYYDISPKFVCELTNVENAFQLCNGGLGVLIYAKLFWDMLDEDVQQDYLRRVDIFPLPYMPDSDYVCAYYNKETGLHGRTKELFNCFVEFFDRYNAQQEKER
mgnify:FL=1